MTVKQKFVSLASSGFRAPAGRKCAGRAGTHRKSPTTRPPVSPMQTMRARLAPSEAGGYPAENPRAAVAPCLSERRSLRVCAGGTLVCVRAWFQPCLKRRYINAALAAEAPALLPSHSLLGPAIATRAGARRRSFATNRAGSTLARAGGLRSSDAAGIRRFTPGIPTRAALVSCTLGGGALDPPLGRARERATFRAGPSARSRRLLFAATASHGAERSIDLAHM